MAEKPEIVSFPTSDGGVFYADICGTGEHAVVRYMREQGADTLSVVGASFGGWKTALAAVEVEPGEIDGIVLLAGSAIGEPEKMKGRKLFITSRGETSAVRVRSACHRSAISTSAPEPKEFVILEGSAHAQFVFETEQGERLMFEILRFLSADLPEVSR